MEDAVGVRPLWQVVFGVPVTADGNVLAGERAAEAQSRVLQGGRFSGRRLHRQLPRTGREVTQGAVMDDAICPVRLPGLGLHCGRYGGWFKVGWVWD